MTQSVDLFGTHLLLDRGATVTAYSNIVQPGPEECGCLYCRNWIAARANILTLEWRALLNTLGVPDSGEIEVWRVPGVRKPHGYGGWYTVVGEILRHPDVDIEMADCSMHFSQGASYPVSAFAGLNVLELHFFTEIDTFVRAEYG